MERKIKAVLFDVDGTLYPFGKKEMPQSTINALNLLRARGIRLFVATGRHPAMLTDLRKTFTFDGYISLNGQYAWAGEEVVRSVPLAKSDLAQFVCELDHMPFSCIFLEIGGGYANVVDDKVKMFSQLYDVPLPSQQPVERALQGNVYQVIAFMNQEEQDKLARLVTGPDFVRWSPMFVDIVAKNGGKEKGMQVMGERFGIHLEEIMAFGDAENDVAMLQAAGLSVAMGNGTKETFDVADYVTTAVEEDGIYRALLQYKIIE